MPSSVKRSFVRVLPLLPIVFLCTACATGGSFETGATPPPVEINTWEQHQPKERDHVIDDADVPSGQQHEYGFSVAEPYVVLTTLDPQTVDTSRIATDTEPAFDTLTYFNHPESESTAGHSQSISIQADTWQARPNATDYSGYVRGNEDGRYRLIEHEGSMLKVAGFDFVKVGMAQIAGASKYDRTLVNIFYKGSEKPDAMPVTGTATYDGYWERALETRYNATRNGYAGNLLNASKAHFNVDFGSRRISGALHGRNGDRYQGYAIEAEISGSGFSGTARPEGYSNIEENATVSGSFFGPQATELGGRLMGHQRRAVAVFAAGQTSANDLVQGEPSSYAVVLPASGREDHPAAGLFQDARTIPFSGNIQVLRFNGAVFDLTKVTADAGQICCTEPNFQFMNIGAFDTGSTMAEDSRLLYFAQGHLTPQDQIPLTGQASYKGKWMAYGRAPQGQAYIVRGTDNDARFSADFGARTLTGSLQGQSGADIIDIHGTIDGNRFRGIASIKTSLTADSHAIHVPREARISGTSPMAGAFFGPRANELAGHFLNADNSFGGVFAGKQQIIDPPSPTAP